MVMVTSPSAPASQLTGAVMAAEASGRSAGFTVMVLVSTLHPLVSVTLKV